MKISMMKKLLCAAVSGMMLMGVGCAGETASNTSGEDNSLKNVQDAGKLVLGLDATFKPMGFTDENDQIVGFDIDVAEEVCSRMGIELELYSVNWDTKEQDLNAGTIDCIWNGLSVSEERKQMMLMSEPYMNNEMVFVVNGKSDITALSDLSDAKIGVQNGSTALEILNASEVVANGAVPVELATNVEALQQLELDMVDAVFLDSVVANYEIVSTGKDYKVLEEGLSSEEYAIGFRLGDQALCDEVTKTLKEMVADGKLAEISTEWFGSDVTTIGK
ncbi:MAG: amino acid ABC transporter substrate-binding protein [Oscillospiraceae bacterium]|nr:amino acid ABC transporter substrate-binding protein [Oscillospiraceae bacterium]